MSTAWVRQQAVWMQPWRRRRGSGGLGHRTTLLTLALMLAVPTVLLLWFRFSIAIYAGVMGLLFCAWAWWNAVDGLVRQNRPTLARLLPGQLATLRQQLFAHALPLGLLATLSAMLLGMPAVEAGWVVALALLLLAWLFVEPWLWFVVSLVPAAVPLLQLPWKTWPERLAGLPGSLQLGLAVGWGFALVAVLGQGGRYHQRLQRQLDVLQRFQRARVQGRPMPSVMHGPVLRALALLFTWPLGLQRRWLLRHAGPRNLLARLDLGLGTGNQWPLALWVGVLVAAAMASLLALVFFDASMAQAERAVHAARIGLCIGGFTLALNPLIQRATMLWCRRREQALLVLLPGLPQGLALAAALEQRWRRDFLAVWLGTTAALLLFASFGTPASVRFVAAFAAGALVLPWLAQARHRHQRRQRSSAGSQQWLLLYPALYLPATLAEVLLVPPAASLAAGLAIYALLAWRASPPDQALLPTDR